MSPEQLQGRPVTGSSDLFSLAVTLYQLLTGQLPFRADSMPALMLQDRARAAPADPHAAARVARGTRRVLRPGARQGPGGPLRERRELRAGAARPQHAEAALSVHLKGKLELRGRERRRPRARAQRGHHRHRRRHRPGGAGRRHGRLQGRRGRERHRGAHRDEPAQGRRRARGPDAARPGERPEPPEHPAARRDPPRQQDHLPDRAHAAALRRHGHDGGRRPVLRRQAHHRARRRLAAVPPARQPSSRR